MLSKFKSLVDNTNATIYTEKDFMNEYPVDIEKEDILYIEKALGNDLKIKIESLNYPTGQINRVDFKKLTEELIYREMLLNEDSIYYLQIIQTILDINPNMERLPSFDDEKWKEAMIYCKNYMNFKKCEVSKETLKDNFIKEYNRSKSIKYLMNKGCKIKIEKNNIEFVSGLGNIIIQLNNMIEKFGGINLIIHLLNNIEFNSTFQRFLFLKRTDVLNRNDEIDVPWGYLFNLALKYPEFKYNSKHKKYEKLFNDIINLSKIVVNAICNVQEYNIFEHIFQNEKTFIQHASDLVLYDSLFRIPQGNINLELKLCEIFFSFEDDFFERTLGFSLDDYIQVMEELNNIGKNTGNRIKLNLSKKQDYALPYDDYIKILNTLSHVNPINQDYNFPSDYSKIDFYKRPIVKLDPTKFFIPSIPISTPNFYEFLADKLREPYNAEHETKLDDLFGEKLETLIKYLFDAHNINYISNTLFESEEYNGESDFIIESDASIIIIEVKKKVMRKESKAGISYYIFMDLFRSFVKSQFQANKLEYLLKKYGKVELKSKDGNKYELHWNNKHIKRISLTQLDYGSLYNPYFLEFLLKTLVDGKYTLENGTEKINKEFEKIIKDYKESFKKLNDICHEDFKYYAHFNTYFMSLSQLYEIIKRSTNNNSFYENLPKQYMETGTFDWFYEYNLYLKSKNKT
ncbi:hypothetical protein [uncultured Methanobrevibacter sp.]|uniref:hypothetical protein n=1 Tax=uncultured Methanobrevibacter sp. TaxID=253161 RepID=UPI0025D99925|nr:hypothetical protein [uncultured Methanobrevibacter sp.]